MIPHPMRYCRRPGAQRGTLPMRPPHAAARVAAARRRCFLAPLPLRLHPKSATASPPCSALWLEQEQQGSRCGEGSWATHRPASQGDQQDALDLRQFGSHRIPPVGPQLCVPGFRQVCRFGLANYTWHHAKMQAKKPFLSEPRRCSSSSHGRVGGSARTTLVLRTCHRVARCAGKGRYRSSHR